MFKISEIAKKKQAYKIKAFWHLTKLAKKI